LQTAGKRVKPAEAGYSPAQLLQAPAQGSGSVSFWRTFYHLNWATKNREPLLTPEVEAIIYKYILAKANELGVQMYALDGWLDHAHLAASIPPKESVANTVKMLKGYSSYMFNRGVARPYFAWQSGYGVLTIGAKQLPAAVEYIQRQKEHHRNGSTNIWLERTEDETPEESEQGLTGGFPILRETGCEYAVAVSSGHIATIPDWPNWPEELSDYSLP
jgi:putative transposase